MVKWQPSYLLQAKKQVGHTVLVSASQELLFHMQEVLRG
jgi:hypothetical protein